MLKDESEALMTHEELKRTLWDAANKLRGSVSAAEYKYPVLGLVFLKYVSDLFDAQGQVVRNRLSLAKRRAGLLCIAV